ICVHSNCVQNGVGGQPTSVQLTVVHVSGFIVWQFGSVTVGWQNGGKVQAIPIVCGKAPAPPPGWAPTCWRSVVIGQFGSFVGQRSSWLAQKNVQSNCGVVGHT